MRRRESGRLARLRGRRAELLAAWWLRLKGFRILAQDQRTPVGEIDLVARRGRLLLFVEVKARPDDGRAREALRPAQQARIARAAAWFLSGRPDLQGLDSRYDVVLVTPWRRPRHLADAWRDT